jgi:hypothetical protein
MPDSVKATRATVQIGSFAIDGFMLPDGSYRMSQTQAAECINLSERNARDFLDSKTFKRLAGEGFTPAIFEIESEDQPRGQSRFRALPLEVAVIYWVYQCHRGNKQAFSLLVALATESLERRFDQAFGITRSEDEWNQRFSKHMIEQLENTLKETFDFETATRTENEYLMSVLRQHGIDPWALPSDNSAE